MGQVALYLKLMLGMIIISAFIGTAQSAPGADDIDELIALRAQFIKTGNYREAMWATQKIVDKTSNSGAPFYMRGQVYVLEKNYQRAIEDFQKAMRLDKSAYEKDAQLHYEIGDAYYQWGKYPEAIRFFDRTISLNPGHLQALVARGTSYAQIDKLFPAEADFDAALEIDPEYSWARRNRAQLYFMIDDYEGAIADISKCLEADHKTYSQDYAAFAMRGKAYHNLNQQKKALEDFNRALEVNARYVLALIYRGTLYAEMKEYDRALDDLNRAVAYEPANEHALFSRGVLHNLLDRLDPALQDFRKAHELSRENPTIHLGIISVYSKQGKTDEACLWLRKAVEAGNKTGYRFNLLRRGKDFDNLREAPCYYKELLRPENQSLYD
jgi:tetratricopeptide (TPR) repeat protein